MPSILHALLMFVLLAPQPAATVALGMGWSDGAAFRPAEDDASHDLSATKAESERSSECEDAEDAASGTLALATNLSLSLRARVRTPLIHGASLRGPPAAAPIRVSPSRGPPAH